MEDLGRVESRGCNPPELFQPHSRGKEARPVVVVVVRVGEEVSREGRRSQAVGGGELRWRRFNYLREINNSKNNDFND